jgi:hypothetical protein
MCNGGGAGGAGSFGMGHEAATAAVKGTSQPSQTASTKGFSVNPGEIFGGLVGSLFGPFGSIIGSIVGAEVSGDISIGDTDRGGFLGFSGLGGTDTDTGTGGISRGGAPGVPQEERIRQTIATTTTAPNTTPGAPVPGTTGTLATLTAEERLRRANAAGRRSTILTGGLGDTSVAPVSKKKLGQ